MRNLKISVFFRKPLVELEHQWSSVSIGDFPIDIVQFFSRKDFMRNLKISVFFRKPLVELEHMCYN